MEILQKGKTQFSDMILICPRCECIFIAEPNEYVKDANDFYFCKCPCCKSQNKMREYTDEKYWRSVWNDQIDRTSNPFSTKLDFEFYKRKFMDMS